MATIPVFNNRDKLQNIRQSSLNPAIQKVNSLEHNQGAILQKINNAEQYIHDVEQVVNHNGTVLNTVTQSLQSVSSRLNDTYTRCDIDGETKTVIFKHDTVELGRIDLSPMFTNDGVKVNWTDGEHENEVNEFTFQGTGVSVMPDPSSSRHAVVTINKSLPTGPRDGYAPGINANILGGKSAVVDSINITGPSPGTSIAGTHLNLHMPEGRFEGYAESLYELNEKTLSSEPNQSFAYVRVTDSDFDHVGWKKMRYVQEEGKEPEWIESDALASLGLVHRQHNGHLVHKGVLKNIVVDDSLRIVNDSLILEEHSVFASRGHDHEDLGEVSEIHWEDEESVVREAIPGSNKSKLIVKRSDESFVGSVGFAFGRYNRIEVSGRTGNSTIDKENKTLKIELPENKARVVSSEAHSVEMSPHHRTTVIGNTGLSTLQNKELSIDIPYLKVGKKLSAVMEPSHKSYKFNEPFDKWDDGFQWNPIKEGFHKQWEDDDPWGDDHPWAIFTDAPLSDAAYLVFDGNVEVDTDSESRTSKITVPFLQGSKLGDKETFDIKSLILPENAEVSSEGVVSLAKGEEEGHDVKFILDGKEIITPAITGSSDDIEVGEDSLVRLSGFDRYPAVYDFNGTQDFNIDAPVGKSYTAYVKPDARLAKSYGLRFDEPFSEWLDSLQWNSMKAGEHSTIIKAKGGWCSNLFVENKEDQEQSLIHQTFYPQDGSAQLYRVAPLVNIYDTPWQSTGSVKASNSKDKEGSALSKIIFPEQVVVDSEGVVDLNQMFEDNHPSTAFINENGDKVVASYLTGSREDIEVVERDGEKCINFSGFERYPSFHSSEGTEDFNIDSPLGKSYMAYVKPDEAIAASYGLRFDEPFSEWLDRLQWNTLKSGEHSQIIKAKGGWCSNLYTKNEESLENSLVYQTFYPQDGTSVLFRVSTVSEIANTPWKSQGALKASNSADKEGSAVNKLILPENVVVDGDGVVDLSQIHQDKQYSTAFVDESGTEHVVSHLTGSRGDVEVVEKDGQKYLNFSGFDRYPAVYDLVSDSDFNIDYPMGKSYTVYLKPDVDLASQYGLRFDEPFSQWLDSLQWNTMKSGEHSNIIKAKGGWCSHLFAEDKESISESIMHQTFYPQDGSAPLYRVASVSEIYNTPWSSMGTLKASNSVDKEGSTINKLVFPEDVVIDGDGVADLSKIISSSISVETESGEIERVTAIKILGSKDLIETVVTDGRTHKQLIIDNTPSTVFTDDSGETSIVSQITGSSEDFSVIGFGDVKQLHVSGFDRYPSKYDPLGTKIEGEDFDVDFPGKRSYIAFLPAIRDSNENLDMTYLDPDSNWDDLNSWIPSGDAIWDYQYDEPTDLWDDESLWNPYADDGPGYTFEEPDENWDDDVRWDTDLATDPSKYVRSVGGWVSNMYLESSDGLSGNAMIHQVFYPQDGSNSLYRVAPAGKLPKTVWKEVGGMTYHIDEETTGTLRGFDLSDLGHQCSVRNGIVKLCSSPTRTTEDPRIELLLREFKDLERRFNELESKSK